MQQALFDHLLGEPQVAGIENLQLCLHAQFGNVLGASAQLLRGRDVDRVAIAEIERAAVERANLGQQLFDVGQAGQRPDQIGAGAELHWGFIWADFQIAAHAGSEVDDDVDVGFANTLHDLAIQRHVTAELAGLWVAHMAVDYSGPGFGSLDGGGGDLFRGDGHPLALAGGVARAGERAGNDDVVVHGLKSWCPGYWVWQWQWRCG